MGASDFPYKLSINPSGELLGNTGTYTKQLGDMAGVYRDTAAYRALVDREGADTLVYTVESQHYNDRDGELTVGTSTLLPGRIGEEFAVTRGHLHARSECAELYYCISGHGVMLLETMNGESEAVELRAGEAVNVPGEWIHRSINVGERPFVTVFTYATNAGQDYDLIARAGGMKQLVVTDGNGGWTTRENPDHVGYAVADGEDTL